MVAILMVSVKLSTPGLLKKKMFWNKGYDFIISVHDVTKKILSCHSNYIEHVVTWPKFSNSSLSMREVIITSILWGFDRKNQFFWGVLQVQVQDQVLLLLVQDLELEVWSKTGSLGLLPPPHLPPWIGLRTRFLQNSSDGCFSRNNFFLLERSFSLILFYYFLKLLNRVLNFSKELQ